MKIFKSAHQNNLIQSVENNLKIILVQEWRFFVKSQQSYVFSFFHKVRFLKVHLTPKIFFR